MTNAFNLLDNMDGLAATLAVIAAVFFAIDAVTVHEERLLLVLSLSLGLACLGFLPFNFRPGKPAAVFMGDSGSQVLGFTLGALGLATSWKVAETTVATLMLPILVLAVPILDTALVTPMRLLEGRPIHQGGQDHTSHRLVRGGLSEQRTVVLLAAIAAGLGATSLAYNVLGDYRITLVGVLVTFALLVQFAGFLVDLERGSTPRRAVPGGWMLRTVVLHRRRLLEVLLDFVADLASLRVRLSPDRAGHRDAVPAARLHGRAAGGPRHPLPRVHPPRPLPGHLALRRLTRGGGDRARRRSSPNWPRWESWWRRRRSATSRPGSSSRRAALHPSWSAPRGSASGRSSAARSTLRERDARAGR